MEIFGLIIFVIFFSCLLYAVYKISRFICQPIIPTKKVEPWEEDKIKQMARYKSLDQNE